KPGEPYVERKRDRPRSSRVVFHRGPSVRPRFGMGSELAARADPSARVAGADPGARARSGAPGNLWHGGFDVPGAVVGIIAGDRLVFAKSFGVRRKGGAEPVGPKTVFQIGSTTKAFAATTLALAVD